MSLWSRIRNAFRGDAWRHEIDEEYAAHLADAAEAGRDPDEARRALGISHRHQEASYDQRVVVWLDALRADAVFGWRQLMKRKVTSAAAILSLALATGACTAAFRLIDALLLRPLPIAHPERLKALVRSSYDSRGILHADNSYEYPDFAAMRAAVAKDADLIAVSYAAQPTDVTFGGDQDMEKVNLSYASGSMFTDFGLRPAAGRLLTADDDVTPGAHPFVLLSYDYWTRRFGRDPSIVGRTLRQGNRALTVIGVCDAPFTGTEPGVVVDMFITPSMHPGVTDPSWGWHRTFAMMKPGGSPDAVLSEVRRLHRGFQEMRVRDVHGMDAKARDEQVNEPLELQDAASGASRMQLDYRLSMGALAVLVALVLAIACVNVANLMTVQAASRAREMAVRVSLGAGRRRLVQLVLVEAAWISLLAAITGGWFAWWSAPFVVSMINGPRPTRLLLPLDWRLAAFGLVLSLGVTLLFGIGPALRAASVAPVHALKGGEYPRARRATRPLIAMQVAFCVMVLFIGGLFVATFERLVHKPVGFSPERLLILDTVAVRAQTADLWSQVAAHVSATPGVEHAAISAGALLEGNTWSNRIAINGGSPERQGTFFLAVSPGWLDTMKIVLRDGCDFRPDDRAPGVVIVNTAFRDRYLNGENPVGKRFETVDEKGKRTSLEIVGMSGDAAYRLLREPQPPVVYTPFSSDRKIRQATLTIRTSSADPTSLASMLRQEVPRARSEFRVSNVRTQQSINDAEVTRERLLAVLALFFANVALLLAAVGLYGVLQYTVVQRRKEIGIRMAIGARASNIAFGITLDSFATVAAGVVAGLAMGLASVRFIASLLYQVSATSVTSIAWPAAIMIATALLASLPAVVRAVRINPVEMLRSE